MLTGQNEAKEKSSIADLKFRSHSSKMRRILELLERIECVASRSTEANAWLLSRRRVNMRGLIRVRKASAKFRSVYYPFESFKKRGRLSENGP